MAKKTRTGVWRCVGGFAAPYGDTVISVPDGALVPHEFPYDVMDGRESLFQDVTETRDVEQATAAPGEKRARRNPARTAPPADATPTDGGPDDEPKDQGEG